MRKFLLIAALLAPATLLEGCPKQIVTSVVVPSDREVVPVPDRPGYFVISAGMLKDMYDQQRELVDQLELCQARGGGSPK